MSVLDRTIDRIRQPEYTGENRCMPCTIVNAVIAVVAAAILAVIWIPLGLLTLAIAAGAIYVRGYLVPGTPQLTQRYFPEWLLQLFGKEAVPRPPEPEARADDVDVDELLLKASVVEPCVDEDDLCLEASFEADWWDRIRRLRDDRDRGKRALASILDVEATELDVEDRSDRFVVTQADRTIGRWDSEGAYLADVAVEPLLGDRIAGWDELDAQLRTQALAGLRVFLERCPVCETPLEHIENVQESCCGTSIVGVAIECPDCEARVFSGSIR